MLWTGNMTLIHNLSCNSELLPLCRGLVRENQYLVPMNRRNYMMSLFIFNILFLEIANQNIGKNENLLLTFCQYSYTSKNLLMHFLVQIEVCSWDMDFRTCSFSFLCDRALLPLRKRKGHPVQAVPKLPISR